MFGLFKKAKPAKPEVTALPFTVDFHSHILPGLDDGSPDLETSLDLVSGMYNLGIRHFVATPHIIGDLYRNDVTTITQALELLNKACIEAKLDVTITAAAEYMLDDYFMNMLRRHKETPLLTIRNNLILTEMSYAIPTSNIDEISFEIASSGYKPIMAHPERYLYLHKKKDEYHRMKEHGFLFQLNLLSITGYYGANVAKVAKFLLEEGLIDFVSSDLHHHRHLTFLTENLQVISQALEGKPIQNALLFA